MLMKFEQSSALREGTKRLSPCASPTLSIPAGTPAVFQFIDLHVAVQFSQHHLLKDFFSFYVLASLVED